MEGFVFETIIPRRERNPLDWLLDLSYSRIDDRVHYWLERDRRHDNGPANVTSSRTRATTAQSRTFALIIEMYIGRSQTVDQPT